MKGADKGEQVCGDWESPTVLRSWVQSEAQGQMRLEIKVSHLVRGQQGEGQMCLEPSEGKERGGQGQRWRNRAHGEQGKQGREVGAGWEVPSMSIMVPHLQ